MKSQKLRPPWWSKSLASDTAIKYKVYLKYMQMSSQADYNCMCNSKESGVRSTQINY